MTGAPCRWCEKPLPPGMRRQALFCKRQCRQSHWRFARQVGVAERAALPMKLAYADPPYPGKAGYYRDHPDYDGEVDHGELIQRLNWDYDGWALSTSAAALPDVLALLRERGIEARVAAWIRGERPNATATTPLNAWEPVVFAGERRILNPQPRRTDALQFHSRARGSDPGHVIGAKPAAFADWLFRLLGAQLGDTLDDLYPGSGGIGRAWALFCDPSRQPGGDGSVAA